ncbi:MAG: CidA/LrgA family protein [Pseudomonadota bacterium]|nr:CidA/LrgA family protein [Pseudomonadota bacterium]
MTASSWTRNLLASALQVVALFALNEVGYRVAVWLDLPFPGKVVALIVLFSDLARRTSPGRLLEKAAALVSRRLPLLLVPVVVGVVASGDVLFGGGLATALTLLGGAVVRIATLGRARRLRAIGRVQALTPMVCVMNGVAGFLPRLPGPVRLSPDRRAGLPGGLLRPVARVERSETRGRVSNG